MLGIFPVKTQHFSMVNLNQSPRRAQSRVAARPDLWHRVPRAAQDREFLGRRGILEEIHRKICITWVLYIYIRYIYIYHIICDCILDAIILYMIVY